MKKALVKTRNSLVKTYLFATALLIAWGTISFFDILAHSTTTPAATSPYNLIVLTMNALAQHI